MITQQEAYDSLAPFIQDYIYKKGWKSLNLLQIATIEALNQGDRNLLLTAGTSQGKTEAAFLPMLSALWRKRQTEDQNTSVGILYISPLKALINDQFYRLDEMLLDSEFSITRWHGDASLSGKAQLLEAPGGILQMTPESLESMLLRHPERVPLLFGDLSFVLIDEIHFFINDQRGVQLLILLERLSKMAGCQPLRLGLSATIANTDYALAYLNRGSGHEGKVLAVKAQNQRASVSVTATRIGKEEFPERYIRKLFRQTRDKRTLLFTNSRRVCENLVFRLKAYAKEHGEKDIYAIHHGSISKESREETERYMKTSSLPVCTATTMTLELGIDIGSLDEVIQAADPLSISSMVQRLGRSGRRSGHSSISFQLAHREERGDKSMLDLQLVRSIAMIELYFREGYMEALSMPELPYRMLVHTILAILCEKGCLQPKMLAYHVLELECFFSVSLDDFRDVLHTLLDKKVLTIYEDGALGLADEGERIVNRMDFYAVFEAGEVMTVYYKGDEIGNVERAYHPGDLFFLSGSIWEVVECDIKNHRIDVEESEGDADARYYGGGFTFTDKRVMEKIHEILAGEESFRYLDEGSGLILKDIREKIVRYQLGDLFAEEKGSKNLLLCPPIGGAAIFTLLHILKAHDIRCEAIYLREFLYGIRIFDYSRGDFIAFAKKLLEEKYLIDHAYVARSLKFNGKYFNLLPDHLKAKEIISDILDIDGVRSFLEEVLAQ